MRFFFVLSAVLLIALLNGPANCQTPSSPASPGGQLIEKVIPAPSLSHNLFEIPSEDLIAVYLPPSYETSGKRYPVVYFLPGFGDAVRYYTLYAVFQGFSLKGSMDRLVQENKVRETIVVIVNGTTFLGGSFYVNSPVTGNWEDLVTKDVVSYVDGNYRTLARPESRGIAGHSMGGYGALNIAMRRPDLFGVVYAMSPGLFDEKGLSSSFMFSDQASIDSYLKFEKELVSINEAEARVKFMSRICYMNMVLSELDRSFVYAYGAAFAPDPRGKVPYINYPYKTVGGHAALDSTSWRQFENGFGGLPEKVNRYKDNLLRLRAIAVDYGTQDENPWIPAGCAYFSDLLKKAGVRHEILTFEGRHNDKIRERLENSVLPFFSTSLSYE